MAVLLPGTAWARAPADPLQDPRARLEALIEQHNALKADLQSTRARAAATTARLKAIPAELAKARQRIAVLAANTYRTGPADTFGELISAPSPTDLVDRLATIEHLARTQNAELDEIAALNRQLAQDLWAQNQLAALQSRQEAELLRLTTTVRRDIERLTPLPPTNRSTAGLPTKPPDVSGRAGIAVRYAYAQLGKPYQWGADGPDSFDCSGLVMAAWRAAGVVLPHNAARQYAVVPHIARSQLAPGDLVFYYSDIHHVALYVGQGAVISAPTTGETVRLEAVDYAPIHGYGRPS